MTLLIPIAGLLVGLIIGRWRAALVVTVVVGAAIVILMTEEIADGDDAAYATALVGLALGACAIGVAIRRAAGRGRGPSTGAGA